MICQEDIIQFFERMSWQLRQENIPVLNELAMDYPGFLNYDEINKIIEEETDEEEEEDLDKAT